VKNDKEKRKVREESNKEEKLGPASLVPKKKESMSSRPLRVIVIISLN